MFRVGQGEVAGGDGDGDSECGGKGQGGRTLSICPRGPARQKYHCNVCDMSVISYHLKTHYKAHTNWDQLEMLLKGVNEEDYLLWNYNPINSPLYQRG